MTLPAWCPSIEDTVKRLGLEPFRAPEPLPPVEPGGCPTGLLDEHLGVSYIAQSLILFLTPNRLPKRIFLGCPG
jgi:hypothetical protein